VLVVGINRGGWLDTLERHSDTGLLSWF
jgi:hypothetical protein